MSLPKDRMILLSYINTQLRDNYSSLDGLCAALGEEREHIVKNLAEIGYVYSPELNCFK